VHRGYELNGSIGEARSENVGASIMSITPEEASLMQDQLQEELLESIQEFEHTTGLEVVSVSTEREREAYDEGGVTVGVDVDVYNPTLTAPL
jgi:hypothetical protein